MNSAKNSLAAVFQLFHEVADNPRCLTVKAGGGFIQEGEKLWFGCKLDSDCEALSLFHIQAFTGDADDCVSVEFHTEEIYDLVNEFELFLT